MSSIESTDEAQRRQASAAYLSGPHCARWKRLQRRFEHRFAASVNTSKPIIDFARMVLTTAVLVGLLFYVLNSVQESPPAKEPSTEATLIGGLLTLATIASTGLLALLAGAATWHAASLLSKGFACQWAIYLEAEFNPRKARNAVGPFVVMAVLHAVIMVGIIGAVLMIAVRAMK